MSELKSILARHPKIRPRFILPGGAPVPAHYHLTEVGHVAKNFIDCGGTVRRTESCTLQLWSNDGDPAHRLEAGKFAKILQLGAQVLPPRDLDAEVEYGEFAISQFPIAGYEVKDGHIDFVLASKHTDCLAREKCCPDESACGCATEPTASASACC